MPYQKHINVSTELNATIIGMWRQGASNFEISLISFLSDEYVAEVIYNYQLLLKAQDIKDEN
jgi:hypothetical protein